MKKTWINPIIGDLVCLMLGFLIGLGLGLKQNKKTIVNIPTPVEKSVIDTLYIKHDSLIYRTKVLDSIKHDTIQKVYNLSDSATLQLFLQLVSE